MHSLVGHIQFNIDAGNLGFYRDLMAFLGWDTVYFDPDTGALGVVAHGTDLWFVGGAKDVGNDYDGPGMNHLAFSVERQSDVDAAVVYLGERQVTPLFDTPRHRPEFSASEQDTYYQVMFESPDRILFEIVYTGPRQA